MVWQNQQQHYCYSVLTSQNVFLGFCPWTGGITVHNWGRGSWVRTSTEKKKLKENMAKNSEIKLLTFHNLTKIEWCYQCLSLLDGNWLNLVNHFSFNAFGNQWNWDYLELMLPPLSLALRDLNLSLPVEDAVSDMRSQTSEFLCLNAAILPAGPNY